MRALCTIIKISALTGHHILPQADENNADGSREVQIAAADKQVCKDEGANETNEQQRPARKEEVSTARTRKEREARVAGKNCAGETTFDAA